MIDIFQKIAEHKLDRAIANNELSVPHLHGKEIRIGPNSPMDELIQRCGAFPREVLLLKKLQKMKENQAPLKSIQQLECEISILREIRLSR